jgi:hypothetical protein
MEICKGVGTALNSIAAHNLGGAINKVGKSWGKVVILHKVNVNRNDVTQQRAKQAVASYKPNVKYILP